METVPEESTRLLRLEKGDLDVAAVGTTQLADLEQRIKDQKLPLFVTKTDKKGQPLLSLSTQWINLNHKMLPTSDVNVRPVSLFHWLASGTLWAVESAAAKAMTLFSLV